MGNLLPWKQADFQEAYVEAVVRAELLASASLGAFRESNAGNDDAARRSYEEAEVHHKEVIRLLADLSLRFTKWVEGKKFSDWTKQEVKNSQRLSALSKWTSATMSALLDIHRLTLVELQTLDVPEPEG